MKTTGKIQNKTENSIKIGILWIKFFNTDLIKEIKVNDFVEVDFKDNEKDGKVYHNGKSIKLLEPAWVKDQPQNPSVNSQKLDNSLFEPKGTIKMDNTNVNTLIMSATTLMSKIIEDHGSMEKEKFNETFDNIVKELIKSYQVISCVSHKSKTNFQKEGE